MGLDMKKHTGMRFFRVLGGGEDGSEDCLEVVSMSLVLRSLEPTKDPCILLPFFLSCVT
jgi:hypothetical protein